MPLVTTPFPSVLGVAISYILPTSMGRVSGLLA
jgi:hypothetical protein